MSKLFSTCLLVQQEDSKKSELQITEIDLHPGFIPSAERGRTILLSGGYSSISPESGYPFSATLQLNHTLATFSSEELETLARAELTRINEVNYRSYTSEADNRVCVVSDSADVLNRFIDTYGGMLDIEPLLLKGYHPDFPTATELNFEGHGRGCRLDYQVRSPIDLEQCTYCGACGPACPEQCISENLFLNYESCTFCKACEDACESRAIDVHSALTKVLDIPAVIILGDVRVDLPKGTDRVFYEASLADYFATLFSYQIDEVVTCNNSICQYSGRLGRGCDLCFSSCRYGAISQGPNGVDVDSHKCEECGACISACPTGALQNERFNDSSFVNYFSTVTIPRDGTVVIGDEQSLHGLWWRQQGNRREKVFFLQYDKVESLSLFHSMFLFSRGARRVVFLEGRKHNKETAVLQKQLDLGKEIITRLYDIEDALVSCSIEDFDSVMGQPISGSFGCATGDQRFVNRRQSLAVALELLVNGSGRQVDMQPEGYIPFANVTCNRERCTECMACINDCRIQALRADPQQLTLNYVGAMCVGCGLCVRICPEDALTISQNFTLGSEFFAPAELARAEAMACKSCGKVFGTRKSYDRVMAILSKKEAVDTSHFEYCDTCRVVNLFESD